MHAFHVQNIERTMHSNHNSILNLNSMHAFVLRMPFQRLNIYFEKVIIKSHKCMFYFAGTTFLTADDDLVI